MTLSQAEKQTKREREALIENGKQIDELAKEIKDEAKLPPQPNEQDIKDEKKLQEIMSVESAGGLTTGQAGTILAWIAAARSEGYERGKKEVLSRVLRITDVMCVTADLIKTSKYDLIKLAKERSLQNVLESVRSHISQEMSPRNDIKACEIKTTLDVLPAYQLKGEVKE